MPRFAANSTYAAPKHADAGIRLPVEPINHPDVPGFAPTIGAETLGLFDRIGSPNLWVQYDFCRMQRTQGDRIAHVRIADSAERHEPGTGEINHAFLFDQPGAPGYLGCVGRENVPLGDTSAGLCSRRDVTGDICS